MAAGGENPSSPPCSQAHSGVFKTPAPQSSPLVGIAVPLPTPPWEGEPRTSNGDAWSQSL